MKIVPAPAVADASADASQQAARQAHRARWERIRRNIQLLACGAAVVWSLEWMTGERGRHFLAQDVTILLNLLWGATLLVQKATEP